MATVHLGLGANLGDRAATLRAAIEQIAQRMRVVRVSSVYETAPWGRTDQPAFLNCCVTAETTLRPREVLETVRSMERGLGRTRRERWGPREIDIDILLYDEEHVADADLVIPHPHLLERAFVLVPLAEIAPNAEIPGPGITVGEALARVPRTANDVRPVGPPLDPRRGVAR